MSPSDLTNILSGTLTDDDKNRIVQVIIIHMRFYNKPITFRDLKIIALKLMTSFSKTFEGKQQDGSRLDTGYNGILCKLKNHNDYLNRSHKRGKSLQDSLNIKLKDRRNINAVQNGTINWQPIDYPEGETAESVEEKRLILQELNLSEVNTVETGSDLESLLKQTYASLGYST